jgi:hypothetical protein
VAWSQRKWARVAVWSGTLATSTTVILWFAVLLNRDTQVAGVAGLAIGLASLALSIWQLELALHHPPQPTSQIDTSTQLEMAAKMLAAAVTDQWEAEAGHRALRRPAPLRLHWTTTARTEKVAAPAATIVGGTVNDGRVIRLRLHGSLNELADKFLTLPHRRLVVLGKPGAGKTVLAMLLTLELLRRRQSGEPVPLLLGLSSWDPTAEHLHVWIARRLGQDYPALRDPAFGPGLPRQLAASEWVLPILDGLDELPEPLQVRAIRELDRASGGRPLVVTCRSQEYEKAARVGGEVLAGAAVVELEPIAPAEAVAFLRATTGPAAERWDQVAAHLRAEPGGALAAALSTPLIVAMARTFYTVPRRDPRKLIDLAQGGGQAAVEGYLLDGFIPAAYTNLPAAPGTPESRRRRPPSPEVALRWLTWLAIHLTSQGTRDLAWWELPRLEPRPATSLLHNLAVGLGVGLVEGSTIALVAGATGTISAGPQFGLSVAFELGLVIGVFFGLVAMFTGLTAGGSITGIGQDPPAWVDVRSRRGFYRLVTSFKRQLLAGSVLVIAIGALTWMLGGPVATTIAATSVFWLVTWFVMEVPLTVTDWLSRRTDDGAVAMTPRAALLGDRTRALAHVLMVVAASAILLGLAVGLSVFTGSPQSDSLDAMDWLAIGLGSLSVIVIMYAVVWGPAGRSSWSWYASTHAWLATRGRLPWRLMAFLEDAHRREVLRQVGAVYQFRHARLQDHLSLGATARVGGLKLQGAPRPSSSGASETEPDWSALLRP